MNGYRLWRVLSTGLLLLTLVSLLAAPAAAKKGPLPSTRSPGEPALCQVFSPSAGEVSVLNAVTTVPASPTSLRPGMWAVGYTSGMALNRPALATLTMYHTGRNWQIVPSPNVADENVLTAVAAGAANDVWAVGYAGTAARQSLLALHYNGVEWAPAAVPSVNQSGATLAFTPLADVTLGKNLTTSYMGNQSPALWTYMRLTDVTFLKGAGKPYVVAVGYADTPQGSQPLAYYYDGSIWQALGITATFAHSRLFAVTGTSLTDLWAVGTVENDGVSDAYLFHRDATGWQPIRKGIGQLTDLAVVGNRVFTVGHLTTDTGAQTLVMAYTPASGDWAQIKSYSKDGAKSVLTGLAPYGDKLYAVGYTSNPANDVDLETLVLSFNGFSFEQVLAPNPGKVNELHGAVVNNGVLWTVGTTGLGLHRSTLVLTNNCPVNQ